MQKKWDTTQICPRASVGSRAPQDGLSALMLKSLEDAEINKEIFFRSPNPIGRLNYSFSGLHKASRVCFTPLMRSIVHPQRSTIGSTNK